MDHMFALADASDLNLFPQESDRSGDATLHLEWEAVCLAAPSPHQAQHIGGKGPFGFSQ